MFTTFRPLLFMRSWFSIFSSLLGVPSPDCSSEALGRDAEENREVYFSCTRSCWNNVFGVFYTVSTHFITIYKSTQKVHSPSVRSLICRYGPLVARSFPELKKWCFRALKSMVLGAEKPLFGRLKAPLWETWKSPVPKVARGNVTCARLLWRFHPFLPSHAPTVVGRKGVMQIFALVAYMPPGAARVKLELFGGQQLAAFATAHHGGKWLPRNFCSHGKLIDY